MSSLTNHELTQITLTIINKGLLLRTPDQEKIVVTKLLIYLVRNIPANREIATSTTSSDDDHIKIINSVYSNLEQEYEERKDGAA